MRLKPVRFGRLFEDAARFCGGVNAIFVIHVGLAIVSRTSRARSLSDDAVST